MAKNQFFNWGKSLKLPEMQFHEKFSGPQNPFFAISKMAKNQFFNWEKRFKIERKIILIDLIFLL